MSIYKEMPSSEYRIISGVRYFVRKYGDGVGVFEEELIPVPVKKKITALNKDGTVNTTLTSTLGSATPI